MLSSCSGFLGVIDFCCACLWLISSPEKKLVILRVIQNRHHSLPSLLLAKSLLPTTINAQNYYRYYCKALPIVSHLMVGLLLCKLASVHVYTVYMDGYLEICTTILACYFVGRYIINSSSLLLMDTCPSPHKQYNYCLLWILPRVCKLLILLYV